MSIFKRRRIQTSPQTFLARAVGSLFANGEQGFLNIPYNPDTLLQRRNLLTWSEDFGNAYWGKTRATITQDAIASPGGFADKIEASATGAGSQITANGGGNVTVTPGQLHTAVFRFKAGSVGWVVFNIGNAAGTNFARQWFNLTTGALGSASVVGAGLNASGAAVTPVPGFAGWYDCALSVLPDDTALKVGYYLTNADAAFAATLADFVYAERGQVERGAATSYQRVTDWYTEYMGGAPLVRRNLLSRTNDLTHADWTRGNISLPAKTGEIFATTGEDVWTLTPNQQYPQIYQSFAATPGQNWTYSVYAKAGTAVTLSLVNELTAQRAVFDLQNQIVGNTASATATVQNIGGGWSRYTVTMTVQAGQTAMQVKMWVGNYDALNRSGQTLYVTSPQIELGTVATAYQKITDWTTEQAADDASRLAIRSRILLWQDSTATVPVTKVEDPVGFIVDTSQRYSRLGTELVTNGQFTTDLSGWTITTAGTSTATWTSGAAVLTGDGANRVYLTQALTTVAGRQYRLAFTIGGGFAVGVSFGTTNGGTNVLAEQQLSGASNTVTFTATGTTTWVNFYKQAASQPVTLGGVSVREVILDALSTGRGPEQFSDTGAVFTGESSRVSSGVYRIYTSAGATSGVFAPVGTTFVAGRWYEVMFNVDSVTVAGGGVIPELSSGLTAATTVGPKRYVFQATATATGGVKRGGAVTTDIQVSNLSFREVPGNHAIQSTPTARGVLTARVNKLLSTQAFNNAAWAVSGCTPTDGQTAYDGTAIASKLTYSGTFGYIRQNIGSVGAADVNVIAIDFKAGSINGSIAFWLGDATSTNGVSVIVNATTGVANTPANTGTGTGATVTAPVSLGGGWWRIVLRGAMGTAGSLWLMVSNQSVAGDFYVARPDLRAAGDAALPIPAYQRVNTSSDYDTVGFPHGVRLDGVDDKYLTNAFAGSGSHHTMMLAFKHLGGGTAYGLLMEWGLTSPAHSVGMARANGGTPANLRVDTDASYNQTFASTGAPFDGGTHTVRYTVDTLRRVQVDAGAEQTTALSGVVDFADSAQLGIGSGPVNTAQFSNIVFYGGIYLRSASAPSWGFEYLRKVLNANAGLATS